MPTKRIAAAVVVVILTVLYVSGRLDHALYPVGLNFHTCARNGFGATFCGKELTDYQNRLRGVQRQIQQSQAALAQQAQAAQQQAQQAAQEAQQQVQQAECQADPQLSFCATP